jgi:Fic/DOC family
MFFMQNSRMQKTQLTPKSLNAATLIGYEWLIQHFRLSALPLAHSSRIGGRASLAMDGETVRQTYPASYQLKNSDNVIAHILFALKYDGIAPDVLVAVFKSVLPLDVCAVIAQNPSSKYTRLLGFWYEFFGQTLPMSESLSKAVRGPYITALDENIYYTCHALSSPKNTRWRVRDNVLGTRDFCPFVRKSATLAGDLAFDLTAHMQHLSTDISPEIFRRAIDYLYTKETKSSNDIEGERPSPARLARFIQILADAGKEPTHHQYAETGFTRLQNAIVDPRYAESGYRGIQNYVGQSTAYGLDDKVHYACPPPDWVADMMSALEVCEQRSRGLPAVLRAALVAWGFVFIHPFEDGNGRIHRFLIHDILARDGFVQNGMILPVSAHMLSHMNDYDRSLEAHSRPIMRVLDYRFDAQGQLCIGNLDEAVALWRYPDLTPQVMYLAQIVRQTSTEDLVQELLFLRNYDKARSAMQAIVDLPDKALNLLIRWLHQNDGQLSQTKRQHAALERLTEQELAALINAYLSAFSQGKT